MPDDVNEQKIPITAFETIEQVVDQVTTMRADPKHWGTFRFMHKGRYVTLICGVDAGAMELMEVIDAIHHQGQTELDPRFKKDAT